MAREKTFDIICPYCCHKFKPAEAHFRADGYVKEKNGITNADSEDDKVVEFKTALIETGKEGRKTKGLVPSEGTTVDKQPKKMIDEKLIEYERNILKMEVNDPENDRFMQYHSFVFDWDQKGFIYDENEYSEYGFVQTITLDSEYYEFEKAKMKVRLCPSCHNILPKGAGTRQTMLISIIGDTFSGKTVYLSVMLRELCEDKKFAGAKFFIGHEESEDKYTEHISDIFNDRKLPSASSSGRKLPPFSFRYKFDAYDVNGNKQSKEVDIILYDIAGENLKKEELAISMGYNINYSHGIFLFIDPSSLNMVKRAIDLDKAEIDKNPRNTSDQVNVLDTIYRAFYATKVEKSKVPLALILGKSDILRDKVFNVFEEWLYPNMFVDFKGHDKSLEINEIRTLHFEVRDLFHGLGENQLLNKAEALFEYVGCFIVSSLGQIPIGSEKNGLSDDNEKYVIKEPAKPIRVNEPFYWLLMKNKLINIHENNVYYQDMYRPSFNSIVSNGSDGG